MRSSLFLALASCALTSCGAPAPSPSPAPAPSPSPAPSPTPTPARSPSPALPPAPAFTWEGEQPGFGSSFYRGPITVDDPGGLRCAFRYEESDHTDHLECLDRSGARVWGYDRAGAFVEDAAIVRHGETLFVARYSNISTGCEVTAYDLRSGRELWTRHLLGVGAIGHSEYLNDVQLRWMDGRIVAFGWESAGQYVEALDPASGARVAYRGPASEDEAAPAAAEAPVPGEAATVAWRWDGPQPDVQRGLDATPPSVTTATGRCTFARDTRAMHLECVDRSGRRIWGDDVADGMMNDVALAADEHRLYVSRFSNMAAGSFVTAYDLATGHRLWVTGLRGPGPVVHSIYLHDEQLRLEGGRLIAIGWEIAGRWVEVLDPSTGRDLGNRLLGPNETE